MGQNCLAITRRSRLLIGKTLEGNGTISQMRKQVLRNLNVVVDYIDFRKFVCRIQNFVEIAECQPPALDLDMLLCGHIDILALPANVWQPAFG